MKRTAVVGAKVGVSLALLAYLLSTTDLSALEEKVRSADLVDLLAAVLCFLAMLALATWRWQLLLGALGAPAPIRRLTASASTCVSFSRFLERRTEKSAPVGPEIRIIPLSASTAFIAIS